MLPAQRNKVDISALTEEEQKLFRLYGRLPTRKDVLGNKLKERKYFDSGDYALSKAGKAPQQSVGTAIPQPDTIPHASSPTVAPTTSVLSPSVLSTSTSAPPGPGTFATSQPHSPTAGPLPTSPISASSHPGAVNLDRGTSGGATAGAPGAYGASFGSSPLKESRLKESTLGDEAMDE